MEDEVIETMMFERLLEWGRRIIKRGDEIILQSTSDKGKTWRDIEIPDFRFFINAVSLRSTSTNPYQGLKAENRVQTRSTNNTSLIGFSEDIQAVIDTGQILNKTQDDDGKEIVSFLGGGGTWEGLHSGQVWRDDDNYLRVVYLST